MLTVNINLTDLTDASGSSGHVARLADNVTICVHVAGKVGKTVTSRRTGYNKPKTFVQ